MIDRYTKAVLTVIAGALLAIVMQNATKSAAAQFPGPQKVQICDSINCASLAPVVVSAAGASMTTWGLIIVSTPLH